MMSITTNAYQVSNSLLTGHHSEKHFANLKRGEYTSFAKGEFSHFVIGSTTKGDIEFCQFTKKGSTLNASLSSNGNQKKDGVGILNLFVQGRPVIYLLLICFSFSRHASLTHELKLPVPATVFICSSSSSSKRICFIVLLERSKDFFSFLSCIGNYHNYNEFTFGNYHCKAVLYKKQSPVSARTLTGLLTHNVNGSNTMAMYKSTQTRPKFLWRFFSCQQFKYFIVIASSEQEARSMLPDSPCLFSARFAEGESV
jgi:hypothetical protein